MVRYRGNTLIRFYAFVAKQANVQLCRSRLYTTTLIHTHCNNMRTCGTRSIAVRVYYKRYYTTGQTCRLAVGAITCVQFNLACSRRQMALTCSDCRGPSHCLPSITCLTSSLTKIVFTLHPQTVLHLLCLTFLYWSSNRLAFSQCVVSIYLCFLL